MEANLFNEMLQNNYPNLSKGKISLINAILDDIPFIAKIGKGSDKNMEHWSMIGDEFDVPEDKNKVVICRAAGKSRYNPMKWENAFNLKEGLGNLVTFYSKNQQNNLLGILLTDIWRPVELYEYAKEIEKYERLGISSIAILFSGKTMVPIGWPWR